MHRVCEDHEPVVTTQRGQPAVVMLSLEDDRALEETSYLLRNPANAHLPMRRGWGNPSPASIAAMARSTTAKSPDASVGPLRTSAVSVYRTEKDNQLIAQLRHLY